MERPLPACHGLTVATRWWRVAGVVLLAACLTCRTSSAAGRQWPVPADPAQAKARAQVVQTFGAELADARGSPEKQSALSGKLLEQAAGTQDTDAQYVLIEMAVQAAVQAADVTAAMAAIDRLEKTFRIDPVAVRLEALKGLARAARTPPRTAAVIEAFEAFVDLRIADDEYAAAFEAARLAVEETRRARDAAGCKRAAARLAVVEQIAEAYQALDEPRAVLGRKADDPTANRAFGEFLCFTKGDWVRGLPMLVRGDEPTYRQLATADLQVAKDNLVGFLSVADGWWDLAAKERGRRQEQIRSHALGCYRLALVKLAGLDKARVERRLAEASSDEAAAARTPAKSTRRPGPKVKILLAMYGKPKRTVDVTSAIQNAVAEDPFLPVRVDMYLNGGIDPAPNQHKTLLLRYQTGRTVVERLLHEGAVETLPAMPAEGAPLHEAAEPFTVIAARYGAGVTWLDVTPNVAALVSDPAAAFSFDPKRVADDQARKACRALVVWFDYRGRRYVRVFEHTRKCLLLPP